jgi:hypothetical protein
MLDKLSIIVEEIKKQKKELEQIEKEVSLLDNKRLQKVVESAKEAIIFEKIFKEKIEYNNSREWHSDSVEYFYDENGKALKGGLVGEINLSYHQGNTGGERVDKELFLMDDGSWKVFIYKARWTYYADCSNEYKRTIAENQDISMFDIDEIIKNIIEEIQNSLKYIVDEKNKQIERLKKLKSLKIS